MNNKIEILRAICFTKDDMDTIENLGDSFSELEIDFMVEFKKIYELGLEQLKKFIDKLDEEGKDLDTYSIQYYIDILSNGPLGPYIAGMSKDKKYFPKTPDSMGIMGNVTTDCENITVISTDKYPLGTPVDAYNKIPKFMQETLASSIQQTEDVFRTSLHSSSKHDNTLPIVDKAPQKRCDEEPYGGWVLKSNGNFMVKDPFYRLTIDMISEAIFLKVKESLGEETFRLYKDKKQYSPFDSEKNSSTATINKITKTLGDLTNSKIGVSMSTETVDLLGDVFDSVDRRKSVLKLSSDEKDVEYLLNSNKGQLGS